MTQQPPGRDATTADQQIDLRESWSASQPTHPFQPEPHHTQVIDTRPEYQNTTNEYGMYAQEDQAGVPGTFGYDEQPWVDPAFEQEGVGPRGFGGPLGALVALVTSALLAGLLASAPSLPVRADSTGWAILLGALDVDGPRTLATWWGVVLMILTATWAWAAAGRARVGRRWVRWAAWGLLGIVVLAMSGSHLLALHTQLAQLESIQRLGVPSVVAQHPVETVVALALALPTLVLLIGSSSAQRVLLILGGLVYLIGAVVVGSDRWTVSTNGQYQHVAEVGFEWVGISLVMLGAGLERVRQRRRR